MEYLLEIPKLPEGPYSASEGTPIRGSHGIRRLVAKVLETLATMHPHRDFVVGFAERVTQDPTFRHMLLGVLVLVAHIDFMLMADW